MTILLDDHGQSQGNCGVWSNFSLPEFIQRSKRNIEQINHGGGEVKLLSTTVKHSLGNCHSSLAEQKKHKAPTSDIAKTTNYREPLTTSHVSNLKEIAKSQRGYDNPSKNLPAWQVNKCIEGRTTHGRHLPMGVGL